MGYMLNLQSIKAHHRSQIFGRYEYIPYIPKNYTINMHGTDQYSLVKYCIYLTFYTVVFCLTV